MSRGSGKVDIVCMGCVHHGAAGCDERLADFWYDRILKERDTYAIFGGDMVDGIHERDKRYTHQECSPWCFDGKLGGTIIDRQYRFALKKWEPLAKAGKILWIHAGNHEDALWERWGAPDLTRNWCYELKVPYAGRSALSSLSIIDPRGKGVVPHRNVVNFYSTHGAGSAKTESAALRRLRELMDHFAADVYLMWHVHRRIATAVRRIGLAEARAGKRQRMREFDRVGAVCGTFLNSHIEDITGYGEKAGYSPIIPGPVVIHIKPEYGGPMTRRTRIWASTAVTDENA